MDDDMRTTEIGARIVEAEDGQTVMIVPREQITIERLEAMASAFHGEEFEPASAFVFETRYQRMSDGRKVPMNVKVHPDPRVQMMLHQMREAAMERAIAALADEAGGHVRINGIRGTPWPELAAMSERSADVLAAAIRAADKRKAKAKAQRQARKRNRH